MDWLQSHSVREWRWGWGWVGGWEVQLGPFVCSLSERSSGLLEAMGSPGPASERAKGYVSRFRLL